MKIHETRKTWTVQEISYLRCAYAQAVSLKEMERTLNRSISSINKALIRFQLRQEVETSLKERRKGSASAEKVCLKKARSTSTPEEVQQLQAALTPGLTRYYKRRHRHARYALVEGTTPFAKRVDAQPSPRHRIAPPPGSRKTRVAGLYWVDFPKVLEWLHYIRVRIFYVPEGPLGPDHCYEVLDQRLFVGEREYGYKTKTQILLMANKMRLARNLPIFYVADVTLYA